MSFGRSGPFETPASLPTPPDALAYVREVLGPELYSLWEEHIRTYRELNLPDFLLAPSYWTLRLMRAVADMRMVGHLPGFRRVVYGFLQGEIAQNGFGAAVLLDPVPPDQGEIRQFQQIDADGVDFPLVITTTRGGHHRPAYGPVNGTTGCWATSRVSGSNAIGPAVLTAAHVAIDIATGDPLRKGDAVSLDNGSSGTMADRATCPIDAALVATSEAPGTTRLPVISPWPPQGIQVEFEGRVSGKHTTTVTLVSPVSNPQSTASQMVFYMGDYGQAGDSGALVVCTQGRQSAAGIYVGWEQRLSSNVTEGVGQVGAQIAHALDTLMEVYI